MGRPQFYPKDRQEIALVPAIRALERYREREQQYPASLEELVAAGELDAIPRPRVASSA